MVSLQGPVQKSIELLIIHQLLFPKEAVISSAVTVTWATAQDNGENIPAAFSLQKTVLSIETTGCTEEALLTPRNMHEEYSAPITTDKA